MAFEVDLEELQKEEVIDANKILNEYFTPNNINLKTEINAPLEFTNLCVIERNFNSYINFGDSRRNFKRCKKTLKDTLMLYKEYMVSFKRKSRIEVGDILKALKQQVAEGARSIIEKITGMGKE